MLLSADDTNLLHRSDPDTCKSILGDLSVLLATDPYPAKDRLEMLDREFIQKNLSPGGSADLLAMVYFLHCWKEHRRK